MAKAEKVFSVVVISAAFFLLSGVMRAQDQSEPPTTPSPSSPKPDKPAEDQVPSQEKPPEQKKESANPARYASAAADATKRVGELALVKARDWESGWFTGVFVPKDQGSLR